MAHIRAYHGEWFDQSGCKRSKRTNPALSGAESRGTKHRAIGPNMSDIIADDVALEVETLGYPERPLAGDDNPSTDGENDYPDDDNSLELPEVHAVVEQPVTVPNPCIL